MLAEMNEQSQSDELETIIQEVERQLASGLPLVRLSNVAGIDITTLTSLIQRKPVGFGPASKRNYAEATEKLRTWVADVLRNAASNRQALAMTPTYQLITAALSMAHEAGEIVAVTGGVGIGKSEAAKAYALAHPMKGRLTGVLRVEFRETEKKPTAALAAIGNALVSAGAGWTSYRNGSLLDRICAALSPGDALLLDEYNYLEGGAINIARDLNQAVGVGIAMIGNPDFTRKVWGKSDEFAALANRALRYDFPMNTEDDVDAWLNWKGYLGTAFRKVAIRIVTRPGKSGGLRTLAKVTDHIIRIFGVDALDAELLEETAKKMGKL